MGRLLGTVIHRIKWVFIFILVIFGYLAITGGNIGAAANTMGNILSGVVGGLTVIIIDVVHAIQNASQSFHH